MPKATRAVPVLAAAQGRLTSSGNKSSACETQTGEVRRWLPIEASTDNFRSLRVRDVQCDVANRREVQIKTVARRSRRGKR